VNSHVPLRANCTDFIAKDEWPPNLPDFSTVNYFVWGAMLQALHKLHSKPKTIMNAGAKKCTASDLG